MSFPEHAMARAALSFVVFGWSLALLTALTAPPARGADLLVAAGKKTLAQALAEARPGDTVVLPEGTFAQAIKLPAGVSLRGAGYGKTIVDGGTQPAAVAIAGGEGSRIEDLAVRTKGSAAVRVEGARQVTLRRLLLRGGALGVQLKDVTGGRVENVIVADVLVGVSLGGVRRVVVANCTIAGASSIGLSVQGAEESAVFNNVVADAGIAVVLGGPRRGLAIDHNLYLALFAGKLEGQVGRVSLGPWRDVTGGLDAHSVKLDVKFASPQAGDYRPVSVLDWDPSRATTADWGVAELAGVRAPEADIDGQPRTGPPDLGAYEVPALPSPPPDGTFAVAGAGTTTSAGIFRPDGTLVRYLFQDLPLRQGTYPFHLPARTQLGEAVAPGQYEVRVVESNLGWRYRGITGNAGVSSRRSDTDQDHTAIVRFAADGGLLMGNSWNERGENVRNRDLQTGHARWVFPGMDAMYGLCAASDGDVYCLRDQGKGTYLLSRLDGKTGRPLPWKDAAEGLHKLPDAEPAGMDELDGVLYLADRKNNKVYRSPLHRPAFGQPIAVAAPSQPAADCKRGVLWLLSGADKLVALSKDGQVVADFTGVPAPVVGLAVGGDRLAAASAATGKVHFFDCTDPRALKPAGTVGRGDGPYGELLPDRFHFQAGPYPTPRHVSLALDAAGRLALRDVSGRIVVLDAKGQAVYASIAQFGNKPTVAKFAGDERTRVFDSSGRFSWWVDAKAGTWAPDAYWGLPPVVAPGNPVISYFADAGKKFGVFHAALPDAKGNPTRQGVLFVRFEGHVGRPVLLYTQGAKGGWVALRDRNGDGVIDANDGTGAPVVDPSGKPVTWPLTARWMFGESDGSGDFRTMTGIGPDGVGFVWKYQGLDGQGVPRYRFAPEDILRVKRPIIPSAYDFSKTEDVRSQSESRLLGDGRLLATFQFGHSPRGMGLSNSGAIDLACFNPGGTLRWLRPLNDFGPVQGIRPMGKALLTSWGHQAEWIGLDENGLSLGHLGFPEAAYWTGMWVDHPDQYTTFTGNDGKAHVLVGDYMVNATHWLSPEHYDDFHAARFPFAVSAAAARRLAFLPPRTYALEPKTAPPKVVVRRLNAPLPIDGDLNKWRAAGITPQVLITPATASGSIDGPQDCSAVVRLAYEGQNLYVQVLRFDDVVTFHQPYSKSHLQDTVEIMINGFYEGFQWSVSKYADVGPAMVRRRFFAGNLEELTPAEHAPRMIKVLDNAKDVSERALLETVYGVDLSACKVIVTEFKLPLDKRTYRGSEQSLFPVRPGATFWLGFLIDDNDTPGADVQDLLAWPASYGTFNPKEDGALAVFE